MREQSLKTVNQTGDEQHGLNAALLEAALAEALETMAFISPSLPERPRGKSDNTADAAAPEPPICHVRLDFESDRYGGTLELVAPREFGAILAANAIGADPHDAQSLDRAEDALKELANVTCGVALRRLSTGPLPCSFHLELPKLDIIGVDSWRHLLQQSATVVLLTEGMPLLCRIAEKTRL